MPNLTPVVVSLPVGHFDILRANPQDAQNNPATPSENYVWSVDDPTVASLAPQDVFLQDCKIVGLKPGVTQVHSLSHPSVGTTIGNWTVTVVSGPYDHDAPSADAPV